MHHRPPAFGGGDGQAYSVSALADDDPDPQGRYGAALLFIRWADGGEQKPVGHLETDYLAFGNTPEEALAPLLALTLQEVKSHLDACIRSAASKDQGVE